MLTHTQLEIKKLRAEEHFADVMDRWHGGLSNDELHTPIPMEVVIEATERLENARSALQKGTI